MNFIKIAPLSTICSIRFITFCYFFVIFFQITGGEEFSILLPFTKKEDAVNIAERLRFFVENHKVKIGDTHIKFTISMGVDYVDIENDFNILQSLERADTALYVAKNSGKNKIVAS